MNIWPNSKVYLNKQSNKPENPFKKVLLMPRINLKKSKVSMSNKQALIYIKLLLKDFNKKKI